MTDRNKGADRLLYRHQVHVCIVDAIRQWNEHAQKLHHGNVIDLAALLTEAIVHPNSIISQRIGVGEELKQKTEREKCPK